MRLPQQTSIITSRNNLNLKNSFMSNAVHTEIWRCFHWSPPDSYQPISTFQSCMRFSYRIWYNIQLKWKISDLFIILYIWVLILCPIGCLTTFYEDMEWRFIHLYKLVLFIYLRPDIVHKIQRNIRWCKRRLMPLEVSIKWYDIARGTLLNVIFRNIPN